MQTIYPYCEAFLAVAEHRSFTRAADALSLSKGAVSQSIRQLEIRLKVPLFIRTTRQVRLSDEGEIFYEQCLRLRREMEVTESLVGQFHQSPSGKLRVCCNPHFAKATLPTVIADYLAHFPDVSIDVLCDERMPDMVDERVDIVLGISWPAPDDVVRKVIGHTRYVLCASPQYLEKHGTPHCLADLQKHQYFPHLGRDPATPLMHIAGGEQLHLKPRLALNNISLMKELAMQGLGIVQLHDYVAQKALEHGRLVELLPSLSTPNIPLYVYYQKHRYVQPKIRQFLNVLEKSGYRAN